MTNDDLKKLLGGYATGTLTDAEQKALFDAALQDESIFEALADDQALKETLDDPAHRAEILAALDPAPRRSRWWRWLPAAGAVSAVILVASIAIRNTQYAVKPLIVDRTELHSAAVNEPATPPSKIVQAPARSLASAPKTAVRDSVQTAAKTPPKELAPIEPAIPAPTPPAAAPPSVSEPPSQVASNTATTGQPGTVSPMAARSSFRPPTDTAVNVSAEQVTVATDAVQKNDAKPVAKFTTQVSENGVALSATVLRRAADGQFRPADAITTFKAGETIRLQLAGNPGSTVTVIGTVAGSRQPVFSGPIPEAGSLSVPVQLADKDTQLTVMLSPGQFPIATSFRSATGPTMTAMPQQGMLAGGTVLRDEPTSRRAAKKSQPAKTDEEEKPSMQAQPAAAATPPQTPLTLNLTLKVH